MTKPRSQSSWPRREPPETVQGPGWSHDTVHGLVAILRGVRAGRAAGDLSQAEVERVEQMLGEIERLVLSRSS